ncbi:hypothetical protein RDn1_276 [Candidatus Termititenax dinenymphae]|uniref:Uncharacterized protein n=1 Tax=Candidatus Termititenax dinenymphae TaxID=2218523 RepID=A0A388TJW9_9BACT|nr:hypothetical protein RDn1_276 [Candidatus Termititenax dinenymphae]
MKGKTINVDFNSPLEIRTIGLKALKNTLGVAGMARFIQQYENGIGNYTEEKYHQPELSLSELDAKLGG